MSMYRVHLTYYRPSGTMGSAFYDVDANAPSQALDIARRVARSDKTRRIEKWAKCSAGPLSDPPPFTQPAPIQSGERITLPQAPLVGRVRHTLRDDIVDLVKDDGSVTYGVPVAFIEAVTHRKVAPKPPKVTVEYLSLYPNQYCYAAANPVRTSSYDLSQLVQVKVTRHDGVIVNKEIV
jgi:hypothetical protein